MSKCPVQHDAVPVSEEGKEGMSRWSDFGGKPEPGEVLQQVGDDDSGRMRISDGAKLLVSPPSDRQGSFLRVIVLLLIRTVRIRITTMKNPSFEKFGDFPLSGGNSPLKKEAARIPINLQILTL